MSWLCEQPVCIPAVMLFICCSRQKLWILVRSHVALVVKYGLHGCISPRILIALWKAIVNTDGTAGSAFEAQHKDCL